jgi:hypothetical protein
VGPFLSDTGLPSRSALVAPGLRLAALRWREANVILGRLRPPPSVSTAFLVDATRFSVTPFPGEPHTALCRSELERWRHNTVYCTPAGARTHVLRRALDSRAPVSTRCAQRWDVPGSTMCEGISRFRPAVAFGAGRASVPARRPAVARDVCPARVISATSGRLDGLRGGCDALLRYAIPEGAPLENVPLPARRDTGTFSRTAHPPVREFSCSAGPVILVPRGAREGANRRCGSLGAHGSGARRPPVASRFDALRDLFSGAWLRHARYGRPRSAAALLGPFLRFTGLPSRSALVAPPLRLAALRWRERPVLLE